MKLHDFQHNVVQYLAPPMNMVKTLSVLNVPRQKVLMTGDLIFMLGDDDIVRNVEWYRENKFNTKLTHLISDENIKQLLQDEAVRIFEVNNFDPEIDMDYVVDYKLLSHDNRKIIRRYAKEASLQVIKEFSPFGVFNDTRWETRKSIHFGVFEQWCIDNNYDIRDKNIYKKIFLEADSRYDVHLKRRAIMTKCFRKIRAKRGTLNDNT